MGNKCNMKEHNVGCIGLFIVENYFNNLNKSLWATYQYTEISVSHTVTTFSIMLFYLNNIINSSWNLISKWPCTKKFQAGVNFFKTQYDYYSYSHKLGVDLFEYHVIILRRGPARHPRQEKMHRKVFGKTLGYNRNVTYNCHCP